MYLSHSIRGDVTAILRGACQLLQHLGSGYPAEKLKRTSLSLTARLGLGLSHVVSNSDESAGCFAPARWDSLHGHFLSRFLLVILNDEVEAVILHARTAIPECDVRRDPYRRSIDRQRSISASADAALANDA